LTNDPDPDLEQDQEANLDGKLKESYRNSPKKKIVSNKYRNIMDDQIGVVQDAISKKKN